MSLDAKKKHKQEGHRKLFSDMFPSIFGLDLVTSRLNLDADDFCPLSWVMEIDFPHKTESKDERVQDIVFAPNGHFDSCCFMQELAFGSFRSLFSLPLFLYTITIHATGKSIKYSSFSCCTNLEFPSFVQTCWLHCRWYPTLEFHRDWNQSIKFVHTYNTFHTIPSFCRARQKCHWGDALNNWRCRLRENNARLRGACDHAHTVGRFAAMRANQEVDIWENKAADNELLQINFLSHTCQ